MISKLSEVRDRLAGHSPQLDPALPEHRASVAMILREEQDDLGLLMIRRAENEGDHWSGHIAFPGGRIDASDEGPRAAAEREVREEVGIALRPGERFGRLDDLRGSSQAILVSGFVYGLQEVPRIVLSHEVAEVLWMKLSDLLDPARQVERTFRYREHRLELPAIRVLEEDEPVLWGLSYRFLELFMRLIGRPIPAMPWRSDL